MNAPADRIEGQLAITLNDPQQGVRIDSSRPVLAARLFEGKPANQVLRTIPLLFNVCGQAQGIAAIRAIESADGKRASAQVERLRTLLNAIETLREQIWRVLLDWPTFGQRTSNPGLLRTLTQQLLAMKNAVDPKQQLLTSPGLQTGTFDEAAFANRSRELCQTLRESIYGVELARWQHQSADQLEDWVSRTENDYAHLLRELREHGWNGLGNCSVEPIDRLDDDYIVEQLDAGSADGFIAHPHWHGTLLETGPSVRLREQPLLRQLNERYRNGLLRRLIARLLEIAVTATGLPSLTAEPDDKDIPGLAAVEAARGRLWHRVVLDRGTIARYRILAPTEWNFHPRGVAAQALAGIRERDPRQAELQARFLIHAIDPCVGYTLQVEGAHA